MPKKNSITPQYKQINLWGFENYKIDKPIRLISLFSGYDSQFLALKYIEECCKRKGYEMPKIEHYKTCEWAVKSIQALYDLHFKSDTTDYSKEMTDEQVVDALTKIGISQNYNEPMKKDQIKRINYRKVFNQIKATHNMVNIMTTKAEDLEIKDTYLLTYLLTYSFPCQDLSLAGKGKGMSVSQAEGGTRSGLLWEVERLLSELDAKGMEKPQILLMENVPQVIGQKNIRDFQNWEMKLESLGYQNYIEVLNAKNYGLPQNRERAFMVSILGEWDYEFPEPMKLKYRLNDLLEKHVSDKYLLTDKQIDDIANWNAYEKPLEKMEQIDKSQICPTITTRTGDYTSSMFLVKEANKMPIKNATKQGYLIAEEEEDGVDISSRMQHHRGTVQKGLAQTLQTQCEVGVVVKKEKFENETLKKELCNKLIKDHLVQHSYTSQIMDGNKKCVEKSDGIMITLTTRGDCYGVCTKENNELGIRKLTPRECGRLQGVSNDDITIMSENQSEMSLYHLYGDSICISVLVGIFSKLLGLNSTEMISDYVEEYIIPKEKENTWN